jgi:hypothetical protein
MATSRSDTGDPLEPVLRDVEAELKRRLREACEAEAGGISDDSTAEIRQLEDSLLAAAVAAEQTITLRRQIDRRASASVVAGQPAGEGETVCAPNDAPAPSFKVREFRDASGQLWRAWPVTPGRAREGRTAQRYLGDFHKGWICFEALESPARRRLPQQPAKWAELPDSELVRLLDEAITAPLRKPRHPAEETPSALN